MAPHRQPIEFLVLVAIICYGAGQIARAQSSFDETYRFPTISAGRILEQKGYTVKEYRVTTSDQYSLRLFRATNPEINERELKAPILFVHGLFSDSSIFVINAFGAKPKDLRRKWAASGSLDQLQRQFRLEPSARTLPTLALNLGFPVWLLSLRAPSKTMTEEVRTSQMRDFNSLSASQIQRMADQLQNILGVNISGRRFNSPDIRSNQTSDPLEAITAVLETLGVDPREFTRQLEQDNYWNYTIDQEALIDIPETVDFVLRKENSEKLNIVAHSMGGCETLMTMCQLPEFQRKLKSAILWSPAFKLGDAPIVAASALSEPLIRNYVGPLPPPMSTSMFQQSFSLLCSIPGARPTICEVILDIQFGPSGAMEPVRSEYIGTLNLPSGSLTSVQLLQAVQKGGFIHMFDYKNPEKNLMAYNQTTPPAYNLDNIKFRNLSIYVGPTDGQVAPTDVIALVSRIRVPTKFQIVNSNFFNHNGYFWHIDAQVLAIIPSMYDIMESN